jgi:hypothetical protein
LPNWSCRWICWRYNAASQESGLRSIFPVPRQTVGRDHSNHSVRRSTHPIQRGQSRATEQRIVTIIDRSKRSMNASRSPLIVSITGSDARYASFGFTSACIKGARLHGFEFGQGVDSIKEKRQVGEVDRSAHDKVYFRPNFAIMTTVRIESQAESIPRNSRPAAFRCKAEIAMKPGRQAQSGQKRAFNERQILNQ